ncbi:MAG TPA: hypothetical protein VLB76_16905 [Thermoanaerobaculia bacterium]|jgi:hypothetical protein|nr:hypothetical protein [Thermoanaerobaculia bacterium]
MKRLLTFLVLVSMAAAAHAGDPTTDLLTAPFVQDFILLSTGPGPGGKPVVKYAIDTVSGSPKTANGVIFRSDGEINIYIHDFNPLTQTWVVEAKATPDVSYASIKAFLDDLKALQGSLPQPPAAPAALSASAVPPFDRCAQLTGCDRLTCRINQVFNTLNQGVLAATELQTLVNGATGHQGVTTASTGLIKQQQALKDNNDRARAELDAIRNEYSDLGHQHTQECAAITSRILIDYIQVQSTADQIIAKKEALRGQLGELVKILQPYLQQNAWFGPTLSDSFITSVTPTFENQQTVSASFKERTIQLDDSKIVIKSDDANVVAGKFDVRRSSFFVPERAAAVIYNNLKYPQYGTAMNDEGKMVVERTKDHQPVGGALMLNLVMRMGRNSSVVYPLFQLGVSSAKDFPGFLAGVGLRFVEPFRFSLSIGGMITRYKDLDGNLKVGDVVSGTDDINKHLTYKTSPVVLYGAMQLKF